MAHLGTKDLKDVYSTSKKEKQVWQEPYPQFERLMDNGLMDGLDPNLPEVNDGSLSAALFKLPKRVVPNNLSGTVKAIDRDEAWMGELANIRWRNEIIPHANSQAPFIRKFKDGVRKAAGYGSVPLITLQCEKDGKTYTDVIVAQPQDVTLEAGKVSDLDSDVIFWDVYYTRLQVKNMIEDAKAEMAEAKKTNTKDSYNKWNVPELETIYKSKADEEERDGNETPRSHTENGGTKPKGFKFTIAFQRGVDAPFYMYHAATDKVVREWTNPDPTGDIPVHYLYCYQDMINPYGTGIVKLAGGTQNVLDYMRQADVLATQLGLRPPIMVKGDADSVDVDSLVYAQDALWFTNNTDVERMELASGVYNQLPARMQMYQASLQKLIPTGDTSISGSNSGDPTMSKTPAGVKLAEANLSIDDEDFKDNLYMTFEAVAKSMINTHFANMEGHDLMKVSDEEREILMKGGLEFPVDENGEPSNEVDIVWDDVRATFNFEVEPETDKAADDADKLEGLMKVAELVATDPLIVQEMAMAGKKLNKGELFSEIIALTSDNEKIITDISPEEMAEQEAMAGEVDPMTGMPLEQPMGDEMAMEQEMPLEGEVMPEMPMQEEVDPTEDEINANVEALMAEYGVSERDALIALDAEAQGLPIEDIIAKLIEFGQEAQEQTV